MRNTPNFPPRTLSLVLILVAGCAAVGGCEAARPGGQEKTMSQPAAQPAASPSETVVESDAETDAETVVEPGPSPAPSAGFPAPERVETATFGLG